MEDKLFTRINHTSYQIQVDWCWLINKKGRQVSTEQRQIIKSLPRFFSSITTPLTPWGGGSNVFWNILKHVWTARPGSFATSATSEWSRSGRVDPVGDAKGSMQTEDAFRGYENEQIIETWDDMTWFTWYDTNTTWHDMIFWWRSLMLSGYIEYWAHLIPKTERFGRKRGHLLSCNIMSWYYVILCIYLHSETVGSWCFTTSWQMDMFHWETVEISIGWDGTPRPPRDPNCGYKWISSGGTG